MDKEKQIEEMAKELSPYGFCKITICENCIRKKTIKCKYYSFAKRYTIKNYRKQSDTVREFIQELFAISREQAKGGVYTIKPWTENVIKLAEKYGVKLEDL